MPRIEVVNGAMRRVMKPAFGKYVYDIDDDTVKWWNGSEWEHLPKSGPFILNKPPEPKQLGFIPPPGSDNPPPGGGGPPPGGTPPPGGGGGGGGGSTGVGQPPLWQPPIVGFGWYKDSANACTVHFIALPLYPENVTGYVWDLDDGGATPSTAQNPTHTYTTNGPHHVTLAVHYTDGSVLNYSDDISTLTCGGAAVCEVPDFTELFGYVTGPLYTCETPYPNAVWGPHEAPWASAFATDMANANQFRWGVDGNSAYFQVFNPSVGCGVTPQQGNKAELYLGNDDFDNFPETGWSANTKPRCTVRFRLENDGVDPIVGMDNVFTLGGGFQGRGVTVDINNGFGPTPGVDDFCVINVSGEGGNGNATFPAHLLVATWYTMEVIWTNPTLEIRVWADEIDPRPALATVSVNTGGPPPAVVYDPTFGPEFDWQCQIAVALAPTGNERCQSAVSQIVIDCFP